MHKSGEHSSVLSRKECLSNLQQPESDDNSNVVMPHLACRHLNNMQQESEEVPETNEGLLGLDWTMYTVGQICLAKHITGMSCEDILSIPPSPNRFIVRKMIRERKLCICNYCVCNGILFYDFCPDGEEWHYINARHTDRLSLLLVAISMLPTYRVHQLNGTHGEWTNGDDMLPAADRARRRREARNHRHQRPLNVERRDPMDHEPAVREIPRVVGEPIQAPVDNGALLARELNIEAHAVEDVVHEDAVEVDEIERRRLYRRKPPRERFDLASNAWRWLGIVIRYFFGLRALALLNKFRYFDGSTLEYLVSMPFIVNDDALENFEDEPLVEEFRPVSAMNSLVNYGREVDAQLAHTEVTLLQATHQTVVEVNMTAARRVIQSHAGSKPCLSLLQTLLYELRDLNDNGANRMRTHTAIFAYQQLEMQYATALATAQEVQYKTY